MDFFFQILFWLSILLMFHSYVLFPFIMFVKAKNKKQNNITYDKNDELPEISVILASYNEEKHIEKKIISTLNSNYPPDKIEFLIGSDNSNDKTNEIIKKYTQKYPQIRFFPFKKRTGKIKIINFLKTKSKNEILILTDTKVFFKKNTIYNLVKHFKNPEIKIVGGILVNNKKNKSDISIQENTYMNNEMTLKYREGIICGCSMGVFGAIYSVRKKNMPAIPENFLVDDFFVTMKIIEKNGKAIFDKNAKAEEKITGNFKEEFKRKVRIATGNFQNLKYFIKILKKPAQKKAFYFLSHKIIRWTGPFLIISAFISNIFLLQYKLYKFTLLIFLISITLPLIDIILKNIKINIKILRYFTHFYGMNIALATGFFKYIKGVKSSIWEPSKR